MDVIAGFSSRKAHLDVLDFAVGPPSENDLQLAKDFKGSLGKSIFVSVESGVVALRHNLPVQRPLPRGDQEQRLRAQNRSFILTH